jgi:hypothetical protein
MLFQPLDAEEFGPNGVFGIDDEKILTQRLWRDMPRPQITPPGFASRRVRQRTNLANSPLWNAQVLDSFLWAAIIRNFFRMQRFRNSGKGRPHGNECRHRRKTRRDGPES